MKVYHGMIIVLLIVPLVQAVEEKKSSWDKLKGIFSKKKTVDKNAPQEQKMVNPKEFAQKMLDKTNKILEDKQPKPTVLHKVKGVSERVISRRTEIIETIKGISSSIKEFSNSNKQQLAMVKTKTTTLETVKSELTKTTSLIDSLEKKIAPLEKKEFDLRKARQDTGDTSGNIEKQLRTLIPQKEEIDKKVRVAYETQKQLSSQLGRLRADFLGALIEIIKNSKPTIIYIKLLLNHLELEEGQNLINQLTTFCDTLVRQGDEIIDQMLLKNKGYGTKSIETPQQQLVIIHDYLHSVLKLAQDIQPIITKIEGTMGAINKVANVANKITLGLVPLLKRIPTFLNNIIKVISHAIDLAAEIAPVTAKSVTIAKLKEEVKSAEALLNEAFPF